MTRLDDLRRIAGERVPDYPPMESPPVTGGPVGYFESYLEETACTPLLTPMSGGCISD